MSIRFYSVPADQLDELKAIAAASKKVLDRIAMICDEDEQSSIKIMATKDICESHALLSKELGKQQAFRSIKEMINQITGETTCQTQPRSQTTKAQQVSRFRT